MTLWVGFVDALEALLFTLTQAFGGNLAWAIVAFSLSVRIALLPLTYRIARETQANRAKLFALRPDLEKLRQRFRKDPRRLMTETSRLYAKHDYKPTAGMLGTLIQLPFILGAFQALPIRLQWGVAPGRRLLRFSRVLEALARVPNYFLDVGRPEETADLVERTLEAS